MRIHRGMFEEDLSSDFEGLQAGDIKVFVNSRRASLEQASNAFHESTIALPPSSTGNLKISLEICENDAVLVSSGIVETFGKT